MSTRPYYLDPLTHGVYTRVHIILAHLSRRLIGDRAYSIPMLRRPSSVRHRFTISNIFFSQIAWPIKATFCEEAPWVGGTKICSRNLGHMTKMDTTTIYGKNRSTLHLRNQWTDLDETKYMYDASETRVHYIVSK